MPLSYQRINLACPEERKQGKQVKKQSLALSKKKICTFIFSVKTQDWYQSSLSYSQQMTVFPKMSNCYFNVKHTMTCESWHDMQETNNTKVRKVLSITLFFKTSALQKTLSNLPLLFQSVLTSVLFCHCTGHKEEKSNKYNIQTIKHFVLFKNILF